MINSIVHNLFFLGSLFQFSTIIIIFYFIWIVELFLAYKFYFWLSSLFHWGSVAGKWASGCVVFSCQLGLNHNTAWGCSSVRVFSLEWGVMRWVWGVQYHRMNAGHHVGVEVRKCLYFSPWGFWIWEATWRPCLSTLLNPVAKSMVMLKCLSFPFDPENVLCLQKTSKSKFSQK